ncbi:1-AGP acyltransferase 5 [Intoshia linei]|uniref:1-AGP acyltransferase 5 n=1 Tax=Intoshia linei TaxID=1819745 RepID=A0A177AYZ4_9BILA|nr:1-AGP acyltransferase 5 [Intoshia linei]
MYKIEMKFSTSFIIYAYLRCFIGLTTAMSVIPVLVTIYFIIMILLLPFPKDYSIYSEKFIYAMYQSMLIFFFDKLNFSTKIIMYGDYEKWFNKSGNSILICNHQSYVDWMLINLLCIRRQFMELSYISFMVKDSLKYIPYYGYYFYIHGFIYVSRGRSHSLEKTKNQLEKLKKRPNYNLVIYPEGTCYNLLNEVKLQKSKIFAAKNGFAELHNVLFPRFHGLKVSLQVLNDSLKYVYNITVFYESKNKDSVFIPSLKTFILGYFEYIHINIEQFDILEIKRQIGDYDDDNIKKWLYKTFSQKDEMISQFKNGRSWGKGYEAKCPTFPPLLSTLVCIFLVTATLCIIILLSTIKMFIITTVIVIGLSVIMTMYAIISI